MTMHIFIFNFSAYFMGIHMYLLSANSPTFVIVSHDLTYLCYQPLYSAMLHILQNALYLKCLSDENKKELLSVLIFTLCFKYGHSNVLCRLGMSSSNVFLILLITGDFEMLIIVNYLLANVGSNNLSLFQILETEM